MGISYCPIGGQIMPALPGEIKTRAIYLRVFLVIPATITSLLNSGYFSRESSSVEGAMEKT
jgi:hypothetical protein